MASGQILTVRLRDIRLNNLRKDTLTTELYDFCMISESSNYGNSHYIRDTEREG